MLELARQRMRDHTECATCTARFALLQANCRLGAQQLAMHALPKHYCNHMNAAAVDYIAICQCTQQARRIALFHCLHVATGQRSLASAMTDAILHGRDYSKHRVLHNYYSNMYMIKSRPDDLYFRTCLLDAFAKLTSHEQEFIEQLPPP